MRGWCWLGLGNKGATSRQNCCIQLSHTWMRTICICLLSNGTDAGDGSAMAGIPYSPTRPCYFLPSAFNDFLSCINLKLCNKILFFHDHATKKKQFPKKFFFISGITLILICLPVTLHSKKRRSWTQHYKPPFWLLPELRKLHCAWNIVQGF